VRVSIRTKLLAAFAFVLILTGAVGWVGILNLQTVNGLLVGMHDNELAPIRELGAASTNYNRLRLTVSDHVYSTNDKDMSDAEVKIATYEKAMLANIDAYAKTELSQAEKEEFTRFQADWKAYRTDLDSVLKLSRADKSDEAIALFKGAAREKAFQANDSLQKLIEIKNQLAEEAK
jgi:methyl-accepting chemotaxis protein